LFPPFAVLQNAAMNKGIEIFIPALSSFEDKREIA
jgi:hypothetical protein